MEIFYRLNSIFFFILVFNSLQLKSQEIEKPISIPFSTDSNFITMWNGDQYVPFAIKGVNFGVAKPGTFPGQMLFTREEYGRWFGMIREAGFNNIRLYTLHFPDFYEVLDSFNLVHKNSPLYFFQGIWLEEDLPGYAKDIYFFTPNFDQEIEENIACVHGNKTIASRAGKAYGKYKTDVSKWMIGYIFGREVSPDEIIKTNINHKSDSAYDGKYLSIKNANPFEAWITKRMDIALNIEARDYFTQRPVSFSSWPTLDPLVHHEEPERSEDTASVDLANIDCANAKAGYFAIFHAYPYFPNFISKDSEYQTCSDDLGQNSYLCYLEDLKNHYNHIPLIIGEFGCPSSWGIAHYAQSGMNHGGFDEYEQGQNNLRLLNNIFDSKCGGGCMFNWMDEWFKRTWVTDLMDFDPNRRILWGNVTAAEQNFGLIGFKKEDNRLRLWESFCNQCTVKSIEAGADFSYFNMRLNLTALPDVLDTVWVALDTYGSSIGESVLLNGKTVTNRAEFLLMITYYKAELYVTEAYDLYGNYHHVSAPEQLYHSIATDGKPWRIVRWRNDSPGTMSNQYIGEMRLNRMHIPPTSMDAVDIDSLFIDIHLPWTLINFCDPSMLHVIHDNKNTTATEDTVSEGISVSVFTKDFSGSTSTRFTWETWNQALNAKEYTKRSYDVIKENLHNFPGDPVAFSDSYDMTYGTVLNVDAEEGVLANDYLVDRLPGEAVLDEAPEHGLLFLNRDGSFAYLPDPHFTDEVFFTYRTISDNHISKPVKVLLKLKKQFADNSLIDIYPNPSYGNINIHSEAKIDRYVIYDSKGAEVMAENIEAVNPKLNLNQLPKGVYHIQLFSGNEKFTRPVLLVR